VLLGLGFSVGTGHFVLARTPDDRPIRSDGQEGRAAAGRAVGCAQLGRASERLQETAAQCATRENQAVGRSRSRAERFSLLFFYRLQFLLILFRF
jgi:hypothetical protein